MSRRLPFYSSSIISRLFMHVYNQQLSMELPLEHALTLQRSNLQQYQVQKEVEVEQKKHDSQTSFVLLDSQSEQNSLQTTQRPTNTKHKKLLKSSTQLSLQELKQKKKQIQNQIQDTKDIKVKLAKQKEAGKTRKEQLLIEIERISQRNREIDDLISEHKELGLGLQLELNSLKKLIQDKKKEVEKSKCRNRKHKQTQNNLNTPSPTQQQHHITNLQLVEKCRELTQLVSHLMKKIQAHEQERRSRNQPPNSQPIQEEHAEQARITFGIDLRNSTHEQAKLLLNLYLTQQLQPQEGRRTQRIPNHRDYIDPDQTSHYNPTIIPIAYP